jgi:hypothetical protein
MIQRPSLGCSRLPSFKKVLREFGKEEMDTQVELYRFEKNCVILHEI